MATSLAAAIAVAVMAAPGRAQQPAPVPPTGDIIDPGPPPGTGDLADDATERLFRGVVMNDFASVQSAVAAGARIDATDRFGLSPIDIAIDKGHYDIAHFLLSVRNFQPSGGGPPVPGTAGAAAARDPGLTPRPEAAPATRPPPRPVTTAPPAPSPAMASLPPADPARDPRFAWPKKEPNPFDPAVPVFGALPGPNGGVQ